MTTRKKRKTRGLRFARKVRRALHRLDLGPCLEWIQATEKIRRYAVRDGSPVFSYGPTSKVWRAANGSIPHGMVICHRCDNPPCIRLAHLFLGTRRNNFEDMANKKRSVKYVLPKSIQVPLMFAHKILQLRSNTSANYPIKSPSLLAALAVKAKLKGH